MLIILEEFEEKRACERGRVSSSERAREKGRILILERWRSEGNEGERGVMTYLKSLGKMTIFPLY